MQKADSRMEPLEGSIDFADALNLRNILLATDFSDSSTRALNYALGIAARYAATLHLFHCIDPTPYNMGAPDGMQTACEAAWRDMRRLESELRSSGRAKNVDVKLHVEAADLPTILPQVVRDLDVGLIVAGTHGRRGWKKLALGSVAEVIVDHASCPVLVAGPYVDRNRLEQFGPESILLAGSHCSRSNLAASFALSLTRKYNSRLTVADVLEDQAGRALARVSQFETRDCESMRDAAGSSQASLPESIPEVGSQSEMILRVAERGAADLIVLTVPAGHRFTDRFRSTNSYQVVCGAPCPVLTVRAE